MSDDYLLVPMHLEAMVLNMEADVSTPFLRFRMHYENLAKFFASPEPEPFADASTKQPSAGVYLHWTLPKALRRGVHKDDGSTEFPLVPNRWLVVRIQAGGARGPVKAWVLESDYLAPADTPGSSPFVDPATAGEALPQAAAIGRATLLKDFVETPGQRAPFLTALAPGNAVFSAFEPGVQNVFAFFDDLTDNDNAPIANGEFTYYVAGWYSDSASDPLTQPNLVWVADEGKYKLQWNQNTPANVTRHDFDWFVFGGSTDLPKKTLVHAMSSGISWDRDSDNAPAENFPTDVPGKVRVAIGNTAVDALAAIVRLDQNNQTEADMLAAFQYDLLDKFDEPGSAEAVNLGIREHWYTASSGGTRWTIVREEQDSSSPRLDPLTIEQQANALADLNSKQAEFDRQQRILQSMQWNLFSLWWKTQWLTVNSTLPIYDAPGGVVPVATWLANQLSAHTATEASCQVPDGTDPSQESWYICKVKAQQNLVAQRNRDVQAAEDSVTRLLSHQQLKRINAEQYFAANDPVIVITGLGRSTNFDPLDGLMCRLPSQTVSRLTINDISYGFDSSAQHVVMQMPPLTHGDKVPNPIQDLHVESFLLSPRLFAVNALGDTMPRPLAGTADPKTDSVRQAFKSLPQPAATNSFAPALFAWEEWRQPWVPLLLDWEVTVLQGPAYVAASDPPALQVEGEFKRDLWQFDGTDFNWTGNTEDFNAADSQMVLTGRTFVTPQLSFRLADQLKEYVTKHKSRDPNLEALLEKLEDYLPVFRNQDILSQRLSGLRAMMVERSYRTHVAPFGDIAATVQDFGHGHPMPFGAKRPAESPAVWDFAPLAGTFFVISKLTVIDSFGRTVDLMLSNFSTNPQDEDSVGRSENYFYPIAGRNLATPGTKDPAPGLKTASHVTEHLLQLTPRLVQDAQLSFRLLSNDGNDRDIRELAHANPICAWIVPNHLDRSLALYAPDGESWGEMFLSRHEQDRVVPVWQPDPTRPPADPSAPQSVAAIPNGFARKMIQALWDGTVADNGQSFSDFLQVIDETLWTINPRGQRQDENLSVLIGRPLAIVRAELSLKLKGLPLYNEDWWNTFQLDFGNPVPDDGTAAYDLLGFNGGVSNFLWPVRLGSQVLRNDGFIGYFADDPNTADNTFKVFNTVHLPAEIRPGYLNQIGHNNNYAQLRFVDDTVTPDPKQNQVCKLTMLVDPRGMIHAFSGLLPVVTLDVPSEFVGAALEKMRYMFRAGPFLTAPDQVRIPQPAENKGTWSWFDFVTNATVNLSKADDQARFSTTTPLVKEGWLKFTPHSPSDED